jgi:hypothetical protein
MLSSGKYATLIVAFLHAHSSRFTELTDSCADFIPRLFLRSGTQDAEGAAVRYPFLSTLGSIHLPALGKPEP